MTDRDLQRRVDEALAQRDRQQPPPAFAVSWQAALRAAAARQPRPSVRPSWIRPAFAAAAAIAVMATWSWLGGRSGSVPESDAADLRLARELSPARQWPTATDALLRPYQYAPPTGIEVPVFENPFEESYL